MANPETFPKSPPNPHPNALLGKINHAGCPFLFERPDKTHLGPVILSVFGAEPHRPVRVRIEGFRHEQNPPGAALVKLGYVVSLGGDVQVIQGNSGKVIPGLIDGVHHVVGAEEYQQGFRGDSPDPGQGRGPNSEPLSIQTRCGFRLVTSSSRARFSAQRSSGMPSLARTRRYNCLAELTFSPGLEVSTRDTRWPRSSKALARWVEVPGM